MVQQPDMPVPGASAICCRLQFPSQLPPETASLLPKDVVPQAIISVGCHSATTSGQDTMQCESNTVEADSFITGFVGEFGPGPKGVILFLLRRDNSQDSLKRASGAMGRFSSTLYRLGQKPVVVGCLATVFPCLLLCSTNSKPWNVQLVFKCPQSTPVSPNSFVCVFQMLG